MINEIAMKEFEKTIPQIKPERIPVHSFDVWGVIIDADIVGQQTMDLFEELAKGKLPKEDIEKRISDYKALLKAETWAQKEKGRIIDGVDGYITLQGAKVDPRKGLYPDTLETFAGILNAGQQIIVLGTKPFDTNYLPKEISERMLGVYAGPKNVPETFRNVASSIGGTHNLRDLGGIHNLVSHSEDSLIELRTAAETGLMPRQNLIYVARNNASMQDASIEGFGMTRALKTNDYLQAAERYQKHFRF